MKRTQFWWLLCLIIALAVPMGLSASDEAFPKLTVIYDNYPYSPALKTDWGFSCLIQTNKAAVLFDTGAQPETFNFNFAKLNLSRIDALVISHMHQDHLGGLPAVLKNHPQIGICFPGEQSLIYQKKYSNHQGRLIDITGMQNIGEGIFSSGPFGGEVSEQALVLQTEKGHIILTGCAHPGILNMIRKIKQLFPGKILYLAGGFHLMDLSGEQAGEIASELQKLGVEYISPTHCTGVKAKRILKEVFKDKYIELGVGKEVTPTEW